MRVAGAQKRGMVVFEYGLFVAVPYNFVVRIWSMGEIVRSGILRASSAADGADRGMRDLEIDASESDNRDSPVASDKQVAPGAGCRFVWWRRGACFMELGGAATIWSL